MKQRAKYCCECGKPLPIGSDYWASEQTDIGEERNFCSEECMKKYLKENMVDDIVDQWFDENAMWYTMESDDPYDIYGVNRSDF